MTNDVKDKLYPTHYGLGFIKAPYNLSQKSFLKERLDNITVNEFIPGPVRTKQALKNYSEDDKSSPFNNPNEWVKSPDEVIDLVLHMLAYQGMGPTSQIFSLARR